MDQHVTIEIFGHPFTFKADENSTKAKEVADYLKQEVDRVERQLPDEARKTISKRAILILAALNIANEYFEMKEMQADLLKTMEKKATGLLDSLDTVAP